MRRPVLLLIFGLFWGCGPPAPPHGGAGLVGERAPAFRLPDLSGHETSLDEYRGKIVLLDFWASWCGPCRISMPIIEKLRREYPDDLVLLAVNLQESEGTVRRYVERYNLRARVLLDSDGQVSSSYGVDSIPTQVLVDRHGTVRHVQVGVSPGLGDEMCRRIEELKKS